jgi:hypothetical protein
LQGPAFEMGLVKVNGEGDGRAGLPVEQRNVEEGSIAQLRDLVLLSVNEKYMKRTGPSGQRQVGEGSDEGKRERKAGGKSETNHRPETSLLVGIPPLCPSIPKRLSPLSFLSSEFLGPLSD